MTKYPTRIADLKEKDLAELNFTALLFLHSKIDRIERCLEHLSKQSGYNYNSIDNDPNWHLGDYFKKIDSLVASLDANIQSDIS